MKTFRIKKNKDKKKVKKVKQDLSIQKPGFLDPALQEGNKVLLHTIPEDIKKAKRFFKSGKKYVIQKPPKDCLNTPMAVYLKGSDDKIYQVSFPYFRKLPSKLKIS